MPTNTTGLQQMMSNHCINFAPAGRRTRKSVTLFACAKTPSLRRAAEPERYECFGMKIIAIMLLLFSSFVLAVDVKEFDLKDGIKISILEVPFDPSSRKIENCEGLEILCSIDGVFPYGMAFILRSPRSFTSGGWRRLIQERAT